MQEKDFCKKHGHHWNTYYSIDKLPTTTKNGYKTIRCGACNAIKTKKTIYKLSRPTVTYAKNNKRRKITVRWRKVSRAKGYQVKKVLGKKRTYYTIKSAKTLKKVLSKLKKKKTYKIYVRAYAVEKTKKYYSAWSKVRKIKVRK